MTPSEPGDKESAAFWVNKSYYQFAKRNYAEALACAEHAISLDSAHFEARMAKANALGELSKMNEAQATLTHLMTLEPRTSQDWFIRCMACLMLQRYRDAEACIRGAELSRAPAEIWARMAELFRQHHLSGPAGECELRSRRFGGTRNEYIRSEQEFFSPRHNRNTGARGWENLMNLLQSAMAVESSGNYTKALLYYDMLVQIVPELASIYSSKGLCYLYLRDLSQAKACFEEAVKRNSRLTVAWTNLGNLLATEGELDKGLACLDKALSLEPERQYLWFVRGIVSYEFGILDKAREYMDRALAMDPEWPDARMHMGIFDLRLSWYSEAESNLSRVLELNPELTEAWWHLGDCLSSQGRNDEASTCYKRAETLQKKTQPTPKAAVSKGPGTGRFLAEDLVDCGLLGKGGFGEVRRYYIPSMETMVAVKISHPRFVQDPFMASMFRKEADMWIRLGRHPNIVAALGVREIGGRLAILMEYIPRDRDGRISLEDHIRNKPLNPARFLPWAIQVCRGMEYARSKGLTSHRDIKAANILIGPDGRAKVSDFGLAGFKHHDRVNVRIAGARLPAHLSNVSMCGGGAGTLTHMAPEQFSDAGRCDERSDIYSFGVMLYEMATGTLPFLAPLVEPLTPEKHRQFAEKMERLHKTAPVPSISYPAGPIIRRCMEKDPANRYQTFADARHDLEDLAGGLPAAVPAMPRTPQPPPEIPNAPERNRSTRVPDSPESTPHEMPTDVRRILLEGTTLYQLGKYKDALRYFQKAAALHQGSRDAWMMAAQCCQSLEQFTDALNCYQKVLDIDDTVGTAWFNKGVILLHSHRPEEAFPCFEKAASLGNQPAVSCLNAGMCMLMTGRKREAIAQFQRAIGFDPNLKKAWNFRTFLIEELDGPDAAARSFDEALTIFPGDKEMWTNRGLVLLRAGNLQEACRSLDRALSIDPRYEEARRIHKLLGKCPGSIEKGE